MYSMVLMAALTTGTELPDFGHRGGCCGCYGGYGYGCRGCYGGCYGWGGCYGGCYGWGGCYGGCYGWGGWGVGGYGGGWGYASVPSVPYYAPTALATNTNPSTSGTTRSMYYSSDTSTNDRAILTIHLPTDAQLLVDGKATRSTSATRRFFSPPLEAGKSYHYNFEAKMERDGKIVKIPQRVDVRAGDRRDITISMPEVDRAAERKQAPTQPAERNAPTDRRAQANSR